MRTILFLTLAAICGIAGIYLFVKAPRHPEIRSGRRRWILAFQISTACLLAIVASQLAWSRTTGAHVWLLVVLDLGAWLTMTLGTRRRLEIYRFKAPR